MLVTAGWREGLELVASLRCQRCGAKMGEVILPFGNAADVVSDHIVLSARLQIVCPDRRCEHRNVWPLTAIELCT